MSRVDAVLVEAFHRLRCLLARASQFGARTSARFPPQPRQMNWLDVGQADVIRPHLGESDLLAAVSGRAASIEEAVFAYRARLSGLSQIRNNLAGFDIQ
jgi:hypothetical protein